MNQLDGIRAAAYSLRLPKNKWADHQMLLLESCIYLRNLAFNRLALAWTIG